MAKNFVQLKGVQKTYDGETLVVRDLNLDVQEGEFLTMLGPSGSGKTTTLMMLAGFETATHGEIFMDGNPINRLAPEDRNIGMVFQSYALFPHMSVAENVAFPLTVRGVPKAKLGERVIKALAMVGLKGFEDRRPAQLSGGQQQRVAIARALASNSRVILADEPTGNLDSKSGTDIMRLIGRLSQEGYTIVLITHNDEIARQAQRTVYVRDGRLFDSLEEAELV